MVSVDVKHHVYLLTYLHTHISHLLPVPNKPCFLWTFQHHVYLLCRRCWVWIGPGCMWVDGLTLYVFWVIECGLVYVRLCWRITS